MFKVEMKSARECYWVYCSDLYKSLSDIQRDIVNSQGGRDATVYYRILSDGVPVAEWEPGTGWRYWRSAEAIRQWYQQNHGRCRGISCADFHQLELTHGVIGDYDDTQRALESNPAFYSAANAYLDAHGLLLPEGALPAGLPKVELRTPKDIAAWCRDHFDNQDVRTAIVKARLNIATPRHWVDDAWKDCYANDSTKRIHFNLVRDLHQYPELHRRLSEIIDGYQPEQAPVDVTHGWSPRTIAEWYEHNNGGSGFSFQLWANEQKGRRWHNVWIGKYTLVTWLEDHFHAAAAWLESHGVKAPITIKEAPMATQKSPIFGIKLNCGTCVGFHNVDGRVLFRVAGPALDGQEIACHERHALTEKGKEAATWVSTAPADEWRF